MKEIRNIDLWSVRPAGLQPATDTARIETAEFNSAGRTGQSPMFPLLGLVTLKLR